MKVPIEMMGNIFFPSLFDMFLTYDIYINMYILKNSHMIFDLGKAEEDFLRLLDDPIKGFLPHQLFL